MGAEEVRRHCGPALHHASDSLYGALVANALPPVLKADGRFICTFSLYIIIEYK
jgi:hypothetical protein